MGLTSAKPQFEEDTTKGADQQAAKQPEVPAGNTAKTTDVAVKKDNAVVVATKIDMRALDKFKDAMRVEYNTLNQVIASNGNFLDRESKKVLGDVVVFTLLSFQDSWVVDPGDDDAPDDMVRYSEDGVTCSDGTEVEAHLAFLKANNFPKARLKQRVVVAAAIESAGKTEEFNGTLMQFDLSPKSRTQWMRYTANAAYGLHIGKYTPEQVSRIKATAVLSTKGTDTFTEAHFDVAS